VAEFFGNFNEALGQYPYTAASNFSWKFGKLELKKTMMKAVIII